jgi:hypothetical protein
LAIFSIWSLKVISNFVKYCRQVIFCVLIFAFYANFAHANNITGQIVTPNTAVGVSNGTLTFNLNQAATVVGSFSIAASSVSCYTSTDGSVVQLPNPTVAPIVAYGAAAGSLAGTYYVKVTYFASGVETLASPAFVATVTMPNTQVIVSAPVLQPAAATGYKVYVGTTLGAETLQATTTGFGSTTINTVSAGSALPSTNTSVCSIGFNDTYIPYGTWYNVSLTDSNGSVISGFPQRWVLQGSSVNLANGFPLANVTNSLRFPTALILNPSSNTQQSVNSPLTLNGYSLTAGSLQLTDNATPPACAAGRAVIWENSSHKLQACQNGGSNVAIIDALANGWTQNGTDVRLTTVTNDVVVGLASSDLTPQSGGSSTGVKVGTFDYYVDATANAHVLSVGMLASPNNYSSGPVAVIGNGVSGSQMNGVPIVFIGCLSTDMCTTIGLTEFGRLDTTGQWRFGTLPPNLTEDSVAGSVRTRGNVAITDGGIVVAGNRTNIAVATLTSSNGNFAISTSGTGARTAGVISFRPNSAEAGRWTVTNGNLNIGDTSDSAASMPISIIRSQDSSTIVNVQNLTNPGVTFSASAGLNAVSAAGNFFFEATPTGYTGNGTYSSSKFGAVGFIGTTSGLTNGLAIATGAGPMTVYPASNSTAEFSVASGSVQVADLLGVGLAIGTPPTITLQVKSAAVESARIASTQTSVEQTFYYSTSSVAGAIQGSSNAFTICGNIPCSHSIFLDVPDKLWGWSLLARNGAPSSPPLGTFFEYLDTNDGKLKIIGSSGTVTIVAVP